MHATCVLCSVLSLLEDSRAFLVSEESISWGRCYIYEQKKETETDLACYPFYTKALASS